MKQITIDDLIPFMRNGWIAMDESCNWNFFDYKPSIKDGHFGNIFNRVELFKCFSIAPFDGDWKDSLIKVEHKEEE